MKNRKKKVIVAMSGGVDSSVAAALLKRGGFYPEPDRRVDVVGVFMKFWSEPQSGSTLISADKNADLRRYENRCCSTEAENRARKVAKILDIPFYVFNFEKEFKKRIVDYFLKENKKGNTPNPCVVCNKEIKLGLLLQKALELDADFVATGHYALKREVKSQKSKVKSYQLLMAKDKNKDQSYFLWQLNQKQLGHILFPIGNYTRTEVEKLAKKFKLSFGGVKKSQEICFIPKTINYFLKKYLKPKPGMIMLKGGKKIGEHEGLPFYTIGQRKGIKLPAGPYYVLEKDLKKNLLIVTKNERDLFKKQLIVKNVNWVSGERPRLPLKITAKIRYRHRPASAVISKIQNTKYHIRFTKSQRAITPGQSVVFYKGQELFGGGVIK